VSREPPDKSKNAAGVLLSFAGILFAGFIALVAVDPNARLQVLCRWGCLLGAIILVMAAMFCIWQRGRDRGGFAGWLKRRRAKPREERERPKCTPQEDDPRVAACQKLAGEWTLEHGQGGQLERKTVKFAPNTRTGGTYSTEVGPELDFEVVGADPRVASIIIHKTRNEELKATEKLSLHTNGGFLVGSASYPDDRPSDRRIYVRPGNHPVSHRTKREGEKQWCACPHCKAWNPVYDKSQYCRVCSDCQRIFAWRGRERQSAGDVA
jgi:hypothetical protein